MSGKIPVRIVSDGDGSGTMHRVGVDFGRGHNFEVVKAADQRPGGHVAMTQAVATALGVSTSSFPLDGIATPDMAISTARRLTASYTGSLIRVRNASATEADIGYDGSNVLNTTALLAHTGSGGADTGSIVRAYGQVGTLDGYNATVARQPWIVQAGAINTIGTRPGCKPQTADFGLQTVTTGGTVAANLHGAQGDFTYLIVMIGTTATFSRDFYRLSTNGLQAYSVSPTTRLRVDIDATTVQTADGVNAPGSTVRVYAGFRSGSTIQIWRNSEGAALATGSLATAMAANQYAVLSGDTGSTYAEFYWWNSALSTAQFNAIRANCTTYYSGTYP